MPVPTYTRIFSRPEKPRAQHHSEKSATDGDLNPNRNTPGVGLASRSILNLDPRPGVHLPIILKSGANLSKPHAPEKRSPSQSPARSSQRRDRTSATRHVAHHNGANSRLLQPTTAVEMCDTLNDEIDCLAESLSREHGGAGTAVAVLIYATTFLFTQHGDDHLVDSMPSLAVQWRTVNVFMAKQGVGSGILDAALADLSRANVMADYLASLPG